MVVVVYSSEAGAEGEGRDCYEENKYRRVQKGTKHTALSSVLSVSMGDGSESCKES